MSGIHKHKKKDDAKKKKSKNYDYDDEDDDANGYSDDDDNYQSKKQAGKKRTRNAKNEKQSRKRKYGQDSVAQFLDIEAEEQSGEEDGEEYSDEEIKRDVGQYYKPEELQKRNPQFDINKFEKRILDAGLDKEEEEESMQDGIDEDMEDQDNLIKQSQLPSANDPHLWMVKVKRNQEKVCAMSLMMKAIDFASKGRPLSILSVTAPDNVEGYIYVEAFKEIHVKEAIKGLQVVLGGKILLVPKEEMNGIYRNDKLKSDDVNKYQWVRIKQGMFMGDLGIVENIGNDSKVLVRLIPRLENPKQEQMRFMDKNKKGGPNDKNKNRFVRIPQKIYNQELFQGQLTNLRDSIYRDKDYYLYKKNYYRKGFLFKVFPQKQLQSENVRPTIEEAQKFLSLLQKNLQNDQSEDEQTVESEIKKTFFSANQTDLNKGDKIKVLAGDLIDLTGTVVSIEEGQVIFKPKIEGYNQNIKQDIANITKYFEPGDAVRIIDTKYKGETGLVSGFDHKNAIVVLDQSKKEIVILANYLKLKSEIDQNIYSVLKDSKSGASYNANDMVGFNSNKNVGVVLQVYEDYLKVLNDNGEVQNVKVADVNKKFDKNRRIYGQDQIGNTICVDNVVKCVEGKLKGRKGVVKHIYNTVLFLWDKDFPATNGLFVEKTRNVQILGQEFIKNSQGKAIASMNRRFKDELEGQFALITGGEWKGYRGRVVRADEKQVIIELSSKCKKVCIDRNLISTEFKQNERNNETANAAGQTVYEAGKTPMYYGHTPSQPSYYPHSPHWTQQASPAYGATEYEYNDNKFSRPGSEHKPGTPRAPWLKNE